MLEKQKQLLDQKSALYDTLEKRQKHSLNNSSLNYRSENKNEIKIESIDESGDCQCNLNSCLLF